MATFNTGMGLSLYTHYIFSTKVFIFPTICKFDHSFYSERLRILDTQTPTCKNNALLIMPPTGRCWRGILVSGCPSVHQEPCMLGFWNFIYEFLMEKKLMHIFFLSELSPLWSYAPLKKSKRNLMHAVSYEPYMLGFWNFIYGFLMEK